MEFKIIINRWALYIALALIIALVIIMIAIFCSTIIKLCRAEKKEEMDEIYVNICRKLNQRYYLTYDIHMLIEYIQSKNEAGQNNKFNDAKLDLCYVENENEPQPMILESVYSEQNALIIKDLKTIISNNDAGKLNICIKLLRNLRDSNVTINSLVEYYNVVVHKFESKYGTKKTIPHHKINIQNCSMNINDINIGYIASDADNAGMGTDNNFAENNDIDNNDIPEMDEDDMMFYAIYDRYRPDNESTSTNSNMYNHTNNYYPGFEF